MEHISEEQMDKYQNILNEIDEEQKRYETLRREAERRTNGLRAMKLLTKPDFAREKLFRIKAKLFTSVHKIREIFSIDEDLRDHENSIYYYVEIFVSQLFHEKLLNQNWLFNITISNSRNKTSKTIALKNHIANPISVVISFEDSFENSLLVVSLISSDNEKFWPSLQIASIPIDISYKFGQKTPPLENCVNKINQLYTQKSFTRKLLTYKFRCNWNKQEFIENIIRNCYHHFDLVKDLNKSDNLLTIRLNEGYIEFENSILTIEASVENLRLLKKYFFEKRIACNMKDFAGAVGIQIIRDELENEMKYRNVNVHNLLNVYDKYLKFMANYPV